MPGIRTYPLATTIGIAFVSFYLGNLYGKADREVVCSGRPSVVSEHNLPSVPVNHPNPDGSPSSVTKKVMFGRGVVPHVLQMAIASFPPNGSFPAHTHDSMHEIFIALDGKAEFFLSSEHHTGSDSGSRDGDKIVIQKGTVRATEVLKNSETSPFSGKGLREHAFCQHFVMKCVNEFQHHSE
jgi:quercetin dioxygenase-like cupin family protein